MSAPSVTVSLLVARLHNSSLVSFFLLRPPLSLSVLSLSLSLNLSSTGPPSAPQNLVYNINQTTVSLEWSPPADTGGRNDVTYRIICRRCSWEPEECVPCGGNVVYTTQQSGLTDTYVTISELLAHANYSFEVEAVNGVSDLSRTQRLFAAVSIATSQAGKTFSLWRTWSGNFLHIYQN